MIKAFFSKQGGASREIYEMRNFAKTVFVSDFLGFVGLFMTNGFKELPVYRPIEQNIRAKAVSAKASVRARFLSVNKRYSFRCYVCGCSLSAVAAVIITAAVVVGLMIMVWWRPR
jgi:hypothetical protein